MKTQFITISNAQVIEVGNNEIIVSGRFFPNKHLAGARLSKLFTEGCVRFSTDDRVVGGYPNITNTPVAEIETIRTKINSHTSPYASPELRLTFVDGALTMAYVSTHFVD